MPGHDTYRRLTALRGTTRTWYRLIDHEPDGASHSRSATTADWTTS